MMMTTAIQMIAKMMAMPTTYTTNTADVRKHKHDLFIACFRKVP